MSGNGAAGGEALNIDKRTFLAAVVCPTKGWYAVHKARDPITPGLEWRFFTGQEVGRTARAQLGVGLQLPRTPERVALEATAAALARPDARLLFEASFAFDGFAARADALRRNGDAWDVIEVKSGKVPDEGKPKGEYIDDLAYTAFVLGRGGLRIARCTLMLIAREYRLGAERDPLEEVDVTDDVLARARAFATLAPGIAAAIRAEARPPPVLKFACRDCAFFETDCLGVGVTDPLFVLPRLSEKRFEELKGYVRVSALPTDASLTPHQERVATVLRTATAHTDPAGLVRLDRVAWPAYYLDFESINPAFPWFQDTPPYEAIPFQYSIHVCSAPGQVVAHHEYLAPIDADWRRELAETLLDRLGQAGSVIMYTAYEKRMLTYLARVLPDLKPRIALVLQRLFDLESVVSVGYCHPKFAGRTSIKHVLPAMVEDLSYEGLAIRGGDDAGGVFALMRVGEHPPANHPVHRGHLLDYCRLDTLAMVRVHEELWKIRLDLSDGGH